MSKNVEKREYVTGGVKTSKGKAITRYNAQRHAILRKSITDSETVRYKQIFNDLVEDIKPKGYLQEKLTEVLASNLIRLERISEAEADLMKEATSEWIYSGYAIEGDEPGVTATKKHESYVSPDMSKRLMLLSRYQTATENRIYRNIAAIKQLNYEQS